MVPSRSTPRANRSTLTPVQQNALRVAIGSGESIRSIEKKFGISHGAALRYTQKHRSAQDYAEGMRRLVVAPRRPQPLGDWDLAKIRAARDAQMRGKFRQAVRLSEAMRSDDAIFVARNNRTAPQASIAAALQPRSDSDFAAGVVKRALGSVTIPRSVLRSIHYTLADHAVAIGRVVHSPLDDGTRVDMRLEEWPLEFVEWDTTLECLTTQVRDQGTREPIIHGDGQWVVFRPEGDMPWRQNAAILPASLIWAIHTPALQDWAAGARSHGQAKIIGELPEGVALQNDDGSLTDEADAFLTMLADIVNGAAGASLRPATSKTDFLANGSNAWQVFDALVQNREKAAARIYLGTDAILGSVGGAPGVDISALFGVASTILQGDFEVIEQAINTGLLDPWAAVNYGSTANAPRLMYALPDLDPEDASKAESDKVDRLLATIKEWKDRGLVVDQSTIDRLAVAYGVKIVPQLPPATQVNVPITLAPTDVAKVVRVREARASQGLPAFADFRDDMTISEFSAYLDAKAKAPAAPTGTPAASGAPTV
jgi:hypothetical protein